MRDLFICYRDRKECFTSKNNRNRLIEAQNMKDLQRVIRELQNKNKELDNAVKVLEKRFSSHEGVMQIVAGDVKVTKYASYLTLGVTALVLFGVAILLGSE